MKILVVGQGAEFGQPMEMLLTRAGHEVVVASDGERALEKVRGVDCILTDGDAQPFGGLEFIREARQQNPRLTVIVMARCENPENAVEIFQRGADALLKKPFPPALLLRQLEAV